MKKLLLLISLLLSFSANAALIFKSNFGQGVTLNAPSNFFPTGTGAWQSITGTDQDSKYTWPPKFGNINYAGLQLITRGQVTPSTIGDYVTTGIRKIPELITPMRELLQVMREPGKAGDCCDQIPLMLTGPWNNGDVNEVYMSYWFRHADDLAQRISTGGWRMQFEFKTGGYNNTGGGDYRIGTNIVLRNGKPAWLTISDNNANIPNTVVTRNWLAENTVVPVPVGQWFKYEVYWKRSTGSDGRFWSAVNGQVIVDKFGPNKGKYKLPITRIMVNNAYSGYQNPTESRTSSLEIWSTWPCGVGVSCYGK